jgi:hypothetical protein
MGCYEISLGDTNGVGAPDGVRRLIDRVAAEIPVKALAGHFHDTYGMAATNVFAALESGLSAHSIPRWADWAAVLTPKARRATSRPKIWSDYLIAWVSRRVYR